MNPLQFAGVQARSSWTEKAVSGAGALTAICLVFLTTDWLSGYQTAMALLPSMGASAVLVLAVPHGILSQPWPVIGGNTLSAFIGICVALSIDNTYIAAGSAVGLAIVVMHLARCIHPPGGATALVPVIAGPSVQSMGFEFVLTPAFVNSVLIVAVAFVFNNCFRWRRYPAALVRYDHSMYHPETNDISVRHIEAAMETLDEVIDISPEQIKYLVDKADEIMLKEQFGKFEIKVGAYYTNAAAGQRWAVRQVIDISNHPNISDKVVIYRGVAGRNRGQGGTMPLLEFQRWAKEHMKAAKS